MLTVRTCFVGAALHFSAARNNSDNAWRSFGRGLTGAGGLRSQEKERAGLHLCHIDGFGQLLHQHFRVASALVIFFPTSRRQVIRSSFRESALGLEIGERLG